MPELLVVFLANTIKQLQSQLVKKNNILEQAENEEIMATNYKKKL